MVVRTFNVKVRREKRHNSVIRGIKKYAESNEFGKIIKEFVTENVLRIMSTNFGHENIHKTTWILPDRREKAS